MLCVPASGLFAQALVHDFWSRDWMLSDEIQSRLTQRCSGLKTGRRRCITRTMQSTDRAVGCAAESPSNETDCQVPTDSSVGCVRWDCQ